MRLQSYDLDDEDFDRFVLGDPGSLDPGPWIVLTILSIVCLIWWLQ